MAAVSRPANALATQERLLRRGLRLEYATLAWNVVGSVVLLVAAAAVGSLALAGFGVDSVIEIVASAVVVWQLRGTAGDGRDRRALRVIAAAFALLALRRGGLVVGRPARRPCCPRLQRPRGSSRVGRGSEAVVAVPGADVPAQHEREREPGAE
jgi:hypothetical protein